MIQIQIPLIDALGRINADTIDYFQIKPPFFDRIAHTLTEDIIKPNGNRDQQGLHPSDIDANPGCNACH